MKRNEPTCFISYCHEGVDRDIVDYLVFLIRTAMRQKVHVLYDSELRPSENLQKFMDCTLDVDLAVLLLTPQYKKRVSWREGGVYREYKQITDRYWSEREKKSNQNAQSTHSFGLLPVVLSGSISESVPETMSDLYCVNLSGFSVATDNADNFVVSDYIKKKFSREIQKITDHLVTISNRKSQSFQVEREHLYDALFVETKTTEELLTKCEDFFQQVFVSTTAYSYVHNQTSYFLIGRKGSGKSTLARALNMIEPDRYNGCIALSADDVNLGTAFEMLRTDTRSDISTVLPPLLFFEITWQGFLILCIVELLVLLDSEDKITPTQRSFMKPLEQFLVDFRHNHEKSDLKTAFFTFATARLQEYLDHCIDTARPEEKSSFYADLAVSFNVDSYFEFFLGKEVVISLQHIVSKCKKRVLVTLDDFDTIFDIFRRAATSDDDKIRRVDFETDWLRSLLLLVLGIKDGRPQQAPYFKTLDFCITIPKDRYQQIERSERDGYRYGRRTSIIEWSGIDLCDVLYYRLRKIYGDRSKGKQLSHERLGSLVSEVFPSLPEYLSFTFNEKNIRVPLFSYILRHTFWRPRDILIYYAEIFATATIVSKNGYDVTASVIRRIVSEITYQIIKTEFLDEYETTVSNIRQIVNSFMEYPQVFSFEKLQNAIDDMPFLFNEHGGVCNVMIEKIEFLYDIGFLGVVIPPKLRQTLNINTQDCFFFNEGTSPFRTAKKRSFRDVQFAIHPIFSENLQLTYEKNEFLLNFNWDYLYENHLIKTAKRV